MRKRDLKPALLDFYESLNNEKYWEFLFLGDKSRIYTFRQKSYAFWHIENWGIKATARILKVSRRTLQRWCRYHNIFVSNCPDWVYKWADARKKRKEFWKRHGYGL